MIGKLLRKGLVEGRSDKRLDRAKCRMAWRLFSKVPICFRYFGLLFLVLGEDRFAFPIRRLFGFLSYRGGVR